MEVWQDIPGYEGLYYVSESGKIKNNNFVFDPVINKDGYYQCLLRKDGGRKNFVLHRLVALTFIPNPENLPVVNHLDGNKLNCAKNNLEWATVKRNCNHAIETGIHNPFGENNNNHTISNANVLEIKRLLSLGESSRKISSTLNISRSAIQHIKKGRCRVNG